MLAGSKYAKPYIGMGKLMHRIDKTKKVSRAEIMKKLSA